MDKRRTGTPELHARGYQGNCAKTPRARGIVLACKNGAGSAPDPFP
jgi:hypothetical protein